MYVPIENSPPLKQNALCTPHPQHILNFKRRGECYRDKRVEKCKNIGVPFSYMDTFIGYSNHIFRFLTWNALVVKGNYFM